MILIQESKLESVDRVIIKRMWGNGDVDFACSNAIGASGGLVSIWNPLFFKADDTIIHRHFILIQGKVNNDFSCTIVNVCAPNEYVNKRDLWEELKTLKASSQVPWFIGGDFNEI